jgi:DedD protein
MERKSMQRILILTCAAAFTLIQAPSLLAADEDLPQAVVVAPPPFPQTETKQTAENEGIVEITPEMAEQINAKNAAIASPENSVITENGSATSENTTTSNPNIHTIPSAEETTPTQTQSSSVKKSVTAKVHTTNKDLTHFKSTAWAVQLGSFKDKNNARRLVDRLRKAGYQAFSQEIHQQTRVYVGPEFKQTAAAKLSATVEQNLAMHGIVVMYSPLDI